MYYFFSIFLCSVSTQGIFIPPCRCYLSDQTHWKNKNLFPTGDKNKKAGAEWLHHDEGSFGIPCVLRNCSRDRKVWCGFILLKAHGVGVRYGEFPAKTENGQEIDPVFRFFICPPSNGISLYFPRARLNQPPNCQLITRHALVCAAIVFFRCGLFSS